MGNRLDLRCMKEFTLVGGLEDHRKRAVNRRLGCREFAASGPALLRLRSERGMALWKSLLIKPC